MAKEPEVKPSIYETRPLYFIGLKDDEDLALAILEGADPNELDEKGSTPLTVALLNHEDVRLASTLLKYGTVPTDFDYWVMFKRWGHRKQARGFRKLADQFFKARATVPSDVLFAMHDLRVEALDWAIDHGVDINAVDEEGNTLLHLKPSEVEILLSRGADASIVNNKGMTPYQVLESHRNVERWQEELDLLRPGHEKAMLDDELLSIKSNKPASPTRRQGGL